MDTVERSLRYALRSQGKCRATLENLAVFKNPPTVCARLANITSGPQQVNNGAVAHPSAGAVEAPPNKLLEQTTHEPDQWLDRGTPTTTERGDSVLEAVGAIDWASKPSG